MKVKNWTYEEQVIVEEMWKEGKTGSQIAAALNKTRCAVLGYAHRHLAPRRNSGRQGGGD